MNIYSCIGYKKLVLFERHKKEIYREGDKFVF